MPSIVADWQPHYAELFGRHSLALRHSLASSDLFEDRALARLIERSPRETAKLALAAAVKFSLLNPQKKKIYNVDFRVDPEGVRDIAAYEFAK